ncbi:MAG: hypothetical protein HC936_01200 [Leptolyngbyaceae cyanobacterium SU_3_3]|nr:hypothetical protein [Leptolyngbyaceae cyanobacterium SU_3_3]
MDWLPHLNLVDLQDFLLAQTSSPTLSPSSTTSPAADVELLKSQLEFMKWMNTAFLGFLGFLGTLLTWFFNKNLEDAKRLAKEIVCQELTNHLVPLVQTEAENVMRSIRTEQVIGETVVDYYLPSSDIKPTECKLLKGRGFLKVRLWKNRKPNKPLGSVVVFDFVHSPLLDLPGFKNRDRTKQEEASKDRDKIINEKITEIIELKLGKPILVIYTRPGSGRIPAIDEITTNFPQIKYYSAANTPVALMGAVVDAAYVAYGEQSYRYSTNLT